MNVHTSHQLLCLRHDCASTQMRKKAASFITKAIKMVDATGSSCYYTALRGRWAVFSAKIGYANYKGRKKRMQQLLTWRQLLGNIISNPRKRQRIADELGVIPALLDQWARGEINPREHALRRLVQILPEYRTLLLELVSSEFPGFSMSGEERKAGISDKIPAAFYARAINAYATTPDAQRFWSISNLLLDQNRCASGVV